MPSMPFSFSTSSRLTQLLREEIRRVGAAIGGDQPVDPVGVMDGDAEAGHAAERQAHHGRFPDAEDVPDHDDVVDEVLEAMRDDIGRGFAMAADVDAEDPEERGERRDLRVPEMEIGRGAMEEGDPGLALGPLDQDA